jgi:hypothetical protein
MTMTLTAADVAMWSYYRIWMQHRGQRTAGMVRPARGEPMTTADALREQQRRGPARIDMLAVLVHEPRPLSYTAAALLQIEAHALADRPGFKDEWRLTP